MASILRSSKFVRYFSNLTRSLVFNSSRGTEDGLLRNSSCLSSAFIQNFATVIPKPEQSLEKSLKRLDHDVRRTGRISRRDIEEVLEEIRQQRSATSSQSLLVIRCCGNLVPEELPEIRTALVQEIWKTLNTLNVPMDISHYNALLRVYLENEHPFSPTDFLADLEAKGVEPNRVTYQRLISRYCQQGDIEGATRILEFMREKGLPVNENVFNALIIGHSQANDMESASGIIPVMKQAGLEPSADTYTTLLCCYAHHGDIESINRVLDECEKKEIYLLDKDILDVIYALTIHGHGEKVDELLGKIRKSAGYNQDAVNAILRLVNKGYEDVAYKIVKTMPRAVRSDGSLIDAGNFFLKQLVKANRPTEKIVKFCKSMQEEGLNTKAFLVAAEASLTNGEPNCALSLLNELKANNISIRQHYFWPLICSVKSNEIVDILQKMQNDFNIIPSGETLRDYVIPNLNETKPDKIISTLRLAGVSMAASHSSAAYYALQRFKLKDAANIASSLKAYYSPALYRKPLISALAKTNDFDSYIKFVRCLYEYLPRGNALSSTQMDEDDNEDISTSVTNDAQLHQTEVLGQIVYDAAIYFKSNRVEVLEKILSGLVEQGLSISNAQAERIQDIIGSEMTTNISELLGKLSCGDLEPIPVERTGRSRHIDNMSIEEIENLIKNVEARNENSKGLKRELINACLKSRNIEKTEEVIKKLESEDFVITSGIKAQLIELYCFHNKLEDIFRTYDDLKAKEPDFALGNYKSVRVADLLVKNNQIDKAIEFLEKNKKDEPRTDSSFNYKTTCWRLLNTLADMGDVENLEKVFNTLVNNNYIEMNNVVLGPLVKVHITNNDLKKAVDKFEEICNKYQMTPWKNDLSCRLIQAEDAANLQRLTDLSTNIHGEINSLYDLVFSFVECGRIRQARKILETPGLRSRPQRINSACERYRQEGMVQPLEGLIEATKDLNHIDRSEIYYNLLLSYCKEDQPEKALGLWTKMQEEDITPTDAFLIKLAEYLKEKNLEIPFVIPEVQVHKTEKPEEAGKKSNSVRAARTPKDVDSSDPKRNFKIALRENDVDKALKYVENMQDKKLSVQDESLLIEALSKAGRLTEATKYVDKMIQGKRYPISRIFKFYLNQLSNSGDIATIEKYSNLIDDETKKLISFDNRVCNAYINAGKSDVYINKLKETVDAAKSDEDILKAAEKFPRGGSLGILQKNPEFTNSFEEIAEKYASKNILGPINVLWSHYFINGNEEKCKTIWEKHLKDTPRLMFQRILMEAREKKDENLIKKLVNYLKGSKISENALGTAYSCWLDVLSGQEKYEEALHVLNDGLHDVCLDNFNRSALNRIKNGLENSGKRFPHKLPERQDRNDTTTSSSSGSSSSSSSSDDDLPSSSARAGVLSSNK